MKNGKVVILALGLILFATIISVSEVFAKPKTGTLRISGDNSWVGYVNGEKVAEGANWQQASVSKFDLKDGFAQIAIYVHDAEPGAAGRGGFLADIILDDKTYIGTGDKGWKCDSGKPVAERKDGWEKTKFDDTKWKEPQLYEKFGGGIWGFGAAVMRVILKDPDCTANWIWCGPNDVSDEVYFRYTIGTLDVESKNKLSSTWAKIKSTY